MTTPRKLFVNLPVRDLQKTKDFFSALGFAYNPQFTDDKAACMVLGDEAFVMLLSTPFFQGFTARQICDTTSHTEALLALSCTSREEVDQMAEKALSSGGSPAMPAQDHGFMFTRSFYDVDGHHWEVFWMDSKGVQ